MKRLLLLLSFLCSVYYMSAKTTYIPTYFSQIAIKDRGNIVQDSAKTRDFYMEASNGKFAITVIHDSVTQERVKAIKRAKAKAGWGVAASIFASMSAVLLPLNNAGDISNFFLAREIMYSSAIESSLSMNNAISLQFVDINIIIDNFSDEELSVNDSNRGLIWFVPPHSNLIIKSGNPEKNSFRIATVDNVEVNYVTVTAANYLSKHEVKFENADCWLFELTSELFDNEKFEYYKTIDCYIRRDKFTFEEVKYSPTEGAELLKKLKGK